jgi:hypothetical protein
MEQKPLRKYVNHLPSGQYSNISKTLSHHSLLGSINSSLEPLTIHVKCILQHSSLHKPLREIITIK